MVAHLCAIGQPSCNMTQVVGNPLANLLQGSEGIVNPLTNL